MITVCATAAFGQVAQVWRHTVITTHDHRVREGSSRKGHATTRHTVIIRPPFRAAIMVIWA